MDGLDPSKAYLEGAMDRGIFRCFAFIPLAEKHRFSYQESLLQLRRPGDTDPHSWQQLWRAPMLCGIFPGGQETFYLKILRWNIFWQLPIYAVDSSKGSRRVRKVQFFLTLFKPMFKNYVVKGLTLVQALGSRGDRSLLIGWFLLRLSDFSLVGNITDHGRILYQNKR